MKTNQKYKNYMKTVGNAQNKMKMIRNAKVD